MQAPLLRCACKHPFKGQMQLCKSELQSRCRASCHVHFTSAAPALRGQWTVGPLGKCKIIMVAQRVAKWGPLGTKLGAVGPLSISSYVCQIMDSAHRTVGPLSRPLTSKSVAAVPSKAGHGHCKTADPRNYNCHTWGTPNHCLGNGSSCSGHANAGYCARTDGTPNPLPAIAAAVCHRSPYGSNGATAGG